MDKMAYAFMFMRHGSRAPLTEGPSLFAEAMKDFTVEPEMLTPSGMR